MEETQRAAQEIWRGGGARPRLRDGEVHLWLASLSVTSEAVAALGRSLSPDELTAAGRLKSPRDRDDFIAAHGMLRRLLAAYGAGAPHELRFNRDWRGKPTLDRARGSGTLRFNMSHTRGAALYGVALDREIGVDIECERETPCDNTQWAAILAPAELTVLRLLPCGERARLFLRLWTLKEALLKARGDGLSLPPHLLDVSAVPGKPPRIASGDAELEDGVPWTLQNIPVFPGYAAAAAYRGSRCRIVCRNLV